MEPPAPAAKLILIVDDERELLDIVKYNVMKDGLRVELAKNGAAALDKIPSLKPDLVVLDLMLPMISGIDVLASMQHGDSSKIPVIVMTAIAAGSRHRDEAAKYPNVVAVLEKPVPGDRLRAEILSALGPRA